ncbi:MAG TPA: response regulator [Candidatus Acidoferrum sp.]|nr:response regulator [Candidatus Acidoferrum sp.]
METALLVDDERFFLTILGDFVSQRLGMRPLLAKDGATALALMEKEPVNLVLLDIIMPGMDGLEVLRRIKGSHPSLPVIMVTASAAIDNAIVALREGADDFFRKPVDLDELALCVARVLGKVKVVKGPPAPLPPGAERRRAPRVRMEEGSPAQLQLKEVYLLDISLSGALVEHSEPISPGEVYRLTFPVEGKDVQVLARAIREFASHRITMEGGQRRIVYRTGMEFVGLEKGASDLISAYVERLMKQGETEGTH